MTINYQTTGYGGTAYGQANYGVGGRLGFMGWQGKFNRNFDAIGWQSQFVSPSPFGWQARVILYNTNNLRILCEFPSRGAVTGAGNNSWGNPIATGQNWLASSTEPSSTNDFSEFNLNTDVVEQIWRSATGVKTSITLDCDTELTQGIFNDTVGVLNTNLSSSATVRLIGSTSSTFATIGFDEFLEVDGNGEIIFISQTIPLTAFRYWRFEISDASNVADHISIGTIVFGSATIFQGECFVDKVERQLVNFTDGISTEAFTNVQNDRGIKKKLKLNFKNLDFKKANYANMIDIFNTARTTLKCFWVPTPQFPKRFSIFGKLTEIPRETHNVKGENLDFVDFSINVDEAR